MTTELFQEPSGEDVRAGLDKGSAQRTRWEKFLEAEGVPVYQGIGFHDVRELDLGAWARLGGNGAYLELDGLEGLKSMFVLEIPGGGVLNAERHLFHAFYLVVEGRGTTETWVHEDRKQIVEWQPGSLFYLPPNVHHRLVNATNERVLIIASTNAPAIMNIHQNDDFVFNNDFIFPEHYREEGDFYKYDEQIYAIPTTKRAQARTNFYPDIINSELPLDNQRTPGFRRVQPAWQGFRDEAIVTFIAQYPPGRYSRAHFHTAEAVLVCLRGAGYTVNWRREYGLTPWKDGFGDKVNRIDYIPGGLVSAAPGGGDWFHQHFAVSAEPFRVFNMWGGPLPANYRGFDPESGAAVNGNISQGGHAIGFAQEDPHVRELFEAGLAANGLASTMPEDLYTKDL